MISRFITLVQKIVTRKYKNHPTIITETGSRGAKIFLLKWGISINFFKKFFLRLILNTKEN